MSNPLKSFVLSGQGDGLAEEKINVKYANIYTGVWQVSLVDFFVNFSTRGNQSGVLKVKTNLVSGVKFNVKNQSINQDITIRCVGVQENSKFQSFHFHPLWFTVNAPSDTLQVRIKPQTVETFMCSVVLQRVA
jgi:hypothetical protein